MFNQFIETASSGQMDPLGGIGTIVMLVLMLGVMYFVIIRPQKKQEKEVKKMLDELAVGDMIVTIGGIIGEVVSIKDDTVLIETSRDRTRLRMLRSAIKSVMNETKEKKEKNEKEEKKDNKPAVK